MVVTLYWRGLLIHGLVEKSFEWIVMLILIDFFSRWKFRALKRWNNIQNLWVQESQFDVWGCEADDKFLFGNPWTWFPVNEMASSRNRATFFYSLNFTRWIGSYVKSFTQFSVIVSNILQMLVVLSVGYMTYTGHNSTSTKKNNTILKKKVKLLF